MSTLEDRQSAVTQSESEATRALRARLAREEQKRQMLGEGIGDAVSGFGEAVSGPKSQFMVKFTPVIFAVALGMVAIYAVSITLVA